jgi:hypothetical protein
VRIIVACALAFLIAETCGGWRPATRVIAADEYHRLIGPCACPDDLTKVNHRCGLQSAYCRCGGWEPICHAGDDVGRRELNRQQFCGHVCRLPGV